MQSLLVALAPSPADPDPLVWRIAARTAAERPGLQLLRAGGDAPGIAGVLAGVEAVVFLQQDTATVPASVGVEILRGGGETPSGADGIPAALLREAAAAGAVPARAAQVRLRGAAGEPAPAAGGETAADEEEVAALATRCVLRLLEEWELSRP